MTRCYFNFRQGSFYSADEEGCDFENVEDAYLAAVSAAQDMWRELLIQREDPLLCAFEVTDSYGRDLFCLPFSEVLEACRHRKPVRPQVGRANPIAAVYENYRVTRRAASDVSAAVIRTKAALSETRDLLAQVQKLAKS